MLTLFSDHSLHIGVGHDNRVSINNLQIKSSRVNVFPINSKNKLLYMNCLKINSHFYFSHSTFSTIVQAATASSGGSFKVKNNIQLVDGVLF